jgi:hypothetical protein
MKCDMAEMLDKATMRYPDEGWARRAMVAAAIAGWLRWPVDSRKFVESLFANYNPGHKVRDDMFTHLPLDL